VGEQEVFWVVSLSIFFVSAVAFLLAVFLGRIAIFVIPLVCGGIAAHLSSHLSGMLTGIVVMAFIALGVGTSLSCYLYAEIGSLRGRTRRVSKRNRKAISRLLDMIDLTKPDRDTDPETPDAEGFQTGSSERPADPGGPDGKAT